MAQRLAGNKVTGLMVKKDESIKTKNQIGRILCQNSKQILCCGATIDIPKFFFVWDNTSAQRIFFVGPCMGQSDSADEKPSRAGTVSVNPL